ncbi:hypothetical protein ACLOJK_007526, partial [Asimina triloba]
GLENKVHLNKGQLENNGRHSLPTFVFYGRDFLAPTEINSPTQTSPFPQMNHANI